VLWWIALLLLIQGVVFYICVDRLVSNMVIGWTFKSAWMRRHDMDQLFLDVVMLLEDAGADPRLRDAAGALAYRRFATGFPRFWKPFEEEQGLWEPERDRALEYRRSKTFVELQEKHGTSREVVAMPNEPAVNQVWRQMASEAERDAALMKVQSLLDKQTPGAMHEPK
jgi:hypothetical protein